MQTIYSEFLGSISSFHLIELCGPFGKLVGQIFAIGRNDRGKLACVLLRATALPGLHNTLLMARNRGRKSILCTVDSR